MFNFILKTFDKICNFKYKHFFLFQVSNHFNKIQSLILLVCIFFFVHNFYFNDFLKFEGSEFAIFYFHIFSRLIFILLYFFIFKITIAIIFTTLNYFETLYQNNYNSLDKIVFEQELLNHIQDENDFYDIIDSLNNEQIEFFVPILKKHHIISFPDLSKKTFVYIPHNHQIVTDDKSELYNCSQFYTFHNVFMFSKNSNSYRDYIMKEFKLDKNQSFLDSLQKSFENKK